MNEVYSLIRKTASEPATPQTLATLASTPLPVKGQHLVLSDVATLSIKKVPDCVVGAYP